MGKYIALRFDIRSMIKSSEGLSQSPSNAEPVSPWIIIIELLFCESKVSVKMRIFLLTNLIWSVCAFLRSHGLSSSETPGFTTSPLGPKIYGACGNMTWTKTNFGLENFWFSVDNSSKIQNTLSLETWLVHISCKWLIILVCKSSRNNESLLISLNSQMFAFTFLNSLFGPHNEPMLIIL